MQRRNTKKFDLMSSIPNFVIKKKSWSWRPTWDIRRSTSLFKSFLRVEALQETSRRVRPKLCRHPGKSQEDIGWTEALCKDMDEKAQEDHTCTLTKAERLRYKSNWRLAQNSSVKNGGSLASRPVFRAAVALKDDLYRESADYLPPLPPQDQDRLPKDKQVL